MEPFHDFVKKHLGQIKEQVTLFGLSLAFFSGAILCFKTIGETNGIVGYPATFFLAAGSIAVLLYAVICAQKYTEHEVKKIKPKMNPNWISAPIGFFYTCSYAQLAIAAVSNIQ